MMLNNDQRKTASDRIGSMLAGDTEEDEGNEKALLSQLADLAGQVPGPIGQQIADIVAQLLGTENSEPPEMGAAAPPVGPAGPPPPM